MVAKLSIKSRKVNFNSLNRSTYVGYPEGPQHSDSKVTNAELAFILTEGVYFISKGDPVRRIPPRPFVEPGIEKEIDTILPYISDSIKASLEGDEAKAEQSRIKAGIAGENAVRKFIRDYPANGLAPNAPSTVKKKGEDHPLKGLTGELMRRVTYVIRDD